MSNLSSRDVVVFGNHVDKFKQAVDSLEDRVISFNACIDRLAELVNKFTESVDRFKTE